MKLSIVQMLVTTDKQQNLNKALSFIENAALSGSQAVVLPEMFNTPYSHEYFKLFKEPPNGETVNALCKAAYKNKILIFAGSIPEYEDGKIYNTSYVIENNGKILYKYRKSHLFDINIPDKITFYESDTLSSGDYIDAIDTSIGRVGVLICYDIRFPEAMRKLALDGAKLVVVPAAFNMTTGPVHFELTARVRALDNQLYVAMCSPSTDEHGVYTAYGHSLVANPWGGIVGKLGHEEDMLDVEINMEFIEEVREKLPLLKHRRTDLY